MFGWDGREEFRNMILTPLERNGLGLEVAPFFNPMTDKALLNMIYTDYVSTEENRRKASGMPGLPDNIKVPEIDFVWIPGKPLRECAPDDVKFDFAVASHVLEHVPNPIGWLNEILEVMKVGAILAIVLPDKRTTNDYFRHESSDAELVGWWLERPAIPTTAQIYDFLSNGYQPVDGRPPEFLSNFAPSELRRTYEDTDIVNFMLYSFNERKYIDIHCSVWTPDRFVSAVRRMVTFGIMNVAVSEPICQATDFAVHIKKLGEPALRPPAVGCAQNRG